MAITKAEIRLAVQATQNATVGLATVSYTPNIAFTLPFTNGTATNTQADLVGSFVAPMTTSTPLDLDIVGGQLIDGAGNAISPAEVVAIALQAPADNAANVTATTSGANGWDAAIDGIVTLPPGGFLLIGVPSGYAATAGTADLIALAGTTGDSVNVFLLGRSA